MHPFSQPFNKTTPKKYQESLEQKALVRWFQIQYPDLSDLLVFIPNGQNVGPRIGQRLKDMGLRKGFPDLCLFIPRHGHHGLIIELKSEKGRVSKEQSHIMARLQIEGYFAMAAFGWLEAKAIIEEYLA